MAVTPDPFQTVLPLLDLARLLIWNRLAAFSADRARLLCCGDPQVAYQAIMRLLHGLQPASDWIDPTRRSSTSKR
jgi:hypothetical protein